MRTVAIVVQVEDLVAPLCYYAQSILEERHNDEESADCGHVPVMACQQLVHSLTIASMRRIASAFVVSGCG